MEDMLGNYNDDAPEIITTPPPKQTGKVMKYVNQRKEPAKNPPKWKANGEEGVISVSIG